MDDMDMGAIIVIGVIMGVVGFFIGTAVGINRGERNMETQAIEQGVAGYDHATGEWQWEVKD